MLAVERKRSGHVLRRLLIISFLLITLILLLPWTQNIQAPGKVTTIQPWQRPQTIHSVIAGRIEKWYVQEGDFVQEGDTVLFISEVKDDYLDPDLLARTRQQLEAKELSVESYENKVRALDKQIIALEKTAELKLEQTQNKLRQARLQVISDSTDYKAAQANFKIADQQYQRLVQLEEDGLKSRTDLENRDLQLQKARAEMIAAENKLLRSRNELINAQVEINSVVNQYRDAVAKAQSGKVHRSEQQVRYPGGSY
ncbi:MAG: biotin/lipoyl-binding protein [Owenweeksia sp.]|nr:biotin/lipoyl-binding protein [Owenweeksia sp.]